MRQIIPGDVFDGLAAGLQHPAIGQHHFEPHHVVASDSILEATRPAGVAGRIAAEGALLDAARIGREEEADLFDGVCQVLRDHAGFDGGRKVRLVDFQNAIHAAHIQGNAAAEGDGCGGQAGRHAPGDDRDTLPARQLHDLANLFGREGADYHVGPVFGKGAVVRIRHQVFRGRQDVLLADDILKLRDNCLIHGDNPHSSSFSLR